MADRPTVTALAVVSRNDDVLLLKRRGLYAGYWAIPGGKVETGEFVGETVTREILEETGLIVLPRVFAGTVVELTSTEHGIEEFVFLIVLSSVVGGSLRSSSEGEVRWFGKSELPSAGLIPSDRAILESVFREKMPFAKRSLLKVSSSGGIELLEYRDLL